jgi:hypothetical protein
MRDRAVFGCLLALSLLIAFRKVPLFQAGPVWISDAAWTVICTALLAAAGLLSIRGRLRRLPVNRVFALVYFFCFAWELLACFLHPVGPGWRVFALSAMVVFPAFGFVWQNRGDFETLFKMVAWALLLTGVVFFILCMALAPPFSESAEASGYIVSARYQGVTGNANHLALESLGFLVGSYYLIAVLPGRRKALALAASGLSWMLLLLSVSRTSVGAAFILTVLLVCAILKRRAARLPDGGRRARRWILVAVVAVACAAGILAALFLCYRNGLVKLPPSVVSRYFGMFQVALPALESGPRDFFNVLLSQRVMFWETYAQHFNLLGNDGFLEPLPGHEANNAAIEIAYRCGLPAGIAFYAAGIMALVMHAKNGKARLFPVLALVAYVVASQMESIVIAFHYPIIWCFFLTLSVLLFRRSRVDVV